jgi:hypothetical protein
MFVIKNRDYSVLASLILTVAGFGLIFTGSQPLGVIGAALLVCAFLVPFTRLKGQPPAGRTSSDTTRQPSQ